MGSLVTEFRTAYANESGAGLAAVFTPIAPPNNPNRLRSFYQSTNPTSQTRDLKSALFQGKNLKISKGEQESWLEIFVAYWDAICEILKVEDRHPGANAVTIFLSWKKLANMLIRGFLRIFAIKADTEVASGDSGSFGFQEDFGAETNANMEEAARTINRMFTLCLTDRAPRGTSRKWGVYETTNLLFKTYFKINSVSLTKNLLRALEAQSHDIPPLEEFPKSQVVTFEYYVGVIHFLDENYTAAQTHLSRAWALCHRGAAKNRELILTYLIPCHLVTNHTLPSRQLLAPFPRLEAVFRPLSNCIKKGDLVGFDQAMSAGEDEFVKRRIYLPLERGRDIALRNLFRKVYIAGGFEEAEQGQPPLRRTRVPVAEFAAALRIGTHATGRSPIDIDEVECLLSNLIYKGLMKGYIARERGFVVLSKGDKAFPGTKV
ncbi:hypothetical protein N7468_000964 [Penicillium chermesinum]|uniref:Protein CSN12 homolog n=1 Tax=Penicillium chermesinum TaxID=63820 RepID=A0A9W9PHG9_9EURO|nr:uncharacterized protein N7468_000964 [Penicillium chermesinum]KAJ5245981.1 hypothetical protein N7468_000964 [Penicillium chermesinum]